MKAYNDNIIPSIGVCRVNVRYKNRTIQTTMEVVPEQGPSLLRSIDCERLGLVKRVNTVGQAQQTLKAEIHQKYPELFKGNGSLPGTHSFVLKDGSTGVIHAPRRVAFAKRPKLKDELDRQMKLGYLAKVYEPTDWVNSMVMTEKKNGDVRICIDPKDNQSSGSIFKYQRRRRYLVNLPEQSISPRWMPQPASTKSSGTKSRP